MSGMRTMTEERQRKCGNQRKNSMGQTPSRKRQTMCRS
uniref:Uncharacterized protein n=1 Tax=Arundo donax TaxID=35708 RepID=A0A0A8XRU7_ARUDO